MKRTLVSLMSILMALTVILAGCGQQKESTGTPAVGTPAAGTPAAGTPAAGTTDKKVKLSFLSWYNEDAMKPVIEAFNKTHPNIEIEVQFAPPTKDYIEKLKVLSVANEMPDLFYLAAENRIEMMKNGYVADISDLPVFKNLNESNKQAYVYEGKTYAFAPDAWVGGIIYNKKLFAQAGVTPPKTWSELMTVMGKLQKAKIRPIIERGEWLWTLPNNLVTNDVVGKNPNYDAEVLSGKRTYAEGWTAPLTKWYEEAVKPGFVGKDLLGVASQQFLNEFATEKAAMLIGHAGHMKEIKKINPNIDLGVFPFVGTDVGTTQLYGAVNVGLAVGSKTKYKQEATEFINFLGTQEGITPYQKVTGFMVGIPGIKYEVDPALNEIKDLYVSNKAKLYLPAVAFGENSNAILNELVKGIQDVVSGKAKPEEVPLRMDKKKAELDELKKK